MPAKLGDRQENQRIASARVLDNRFGRHRRQPFTYAALELPDDDVAEILSRRTFAADQATAIVAAAATALESLHDRGLRHGAVSPSNILFIGDVPKLSVDTLFPSDEVGRDADLRQLGATITQMMTGETTQEAAAQLASPLREVTLGCWTGSCRRMDSRARPASIFGTAVAGHT